MGRLSLTRRSRARSKDEASTRSLGSMRERPMPGIRELLDIFQGFANQEQRADHEEARESARHRRADTQSSMLTSITSGMRTRTASFGSTSSAAAEEKPLRVEVMRKQGGRVKTWHTRHFVLRRSGLYYYRDEEAMRQKIVLGRILFSEMISASETERIAEKVPAGMIGLLGFRHIFCVHTDDRTYSIAAPSSESQEKWVKAINSAHRKFRREVKRKDALLNEIWRVGGGDNTYAVANQLTKSNSDISEVLAILLGTIDEQFLEDVGKLYAQRQLQVAFHAWKAYHMYVKAIDSPPDEEAAPNPQVFFSKRGSMAEKIARLSVRRPSTRRPSARRSAVRHPSARLSMFFGAAE